MKKLTTRIAVLIAILSLFLTAPGFAAADSHESDHGPMPIAILGSVFGGAMWLVSTPFCLLIAPEHIGDSFDTLVMAPWRATIGED